MMSRKELVMIFLIAMSPAIMPLDNPFTDDEQRAARGLAEQYGRAGFRFTEAEAEECLAYIRSQPERAM